MNRNPVIPIATMNETSKSPSSKKSIREMVLRRFFSGINGQNAAHKLNCGRKPGDGEEERPASSKREGGGSMWVKPAFEVIEVCAEVTAYAYQK